jgi:glutamate racemase
VAGSKSYNASGENGAEEELNHMRNMRTAIPLVLLGVIAALGPGCTSVVEETQPRSIVDLVADGDSALFSVPIERYQTLDDDLPIGVFDSGIGGLTVLNEIVTIDRFDNRTHEPGADGRPDFEDESFVYLGDQANMPYGNYPSEDKVDFLEELIVKDTVFLLGNRYWLSRTAEAPRRDKPPVKAIVVACNTATAYGLDDIHRALERWGVPVFTVGVVAAGADGAIESLLETGPNGAVAVMATVGTCASGGYPREIARASREGGIDPPEVIQQGSLGLAGAIEGSPEFVAAEDAAATATYRGPAVGNSTAPIEPELIGAYGFEPEGILGDLEQPETWRLNSIENYIRYDTATLVENHRKAGSTDPISTVILGCTHFPFHQADIERSFHRLREFRTVSGEAPYEHLIAEDIIFVDPARLTAVQLYEALTERELFDDDNPGGATADEFFISVPNADCPGVVLRPDGLSFTYAYKYGRTPGELDLEYVKRVPMSRTNLGDAAVATIRRTMPGVWTRLVAFSAYNPRCTDLPDEARIRETD